MLPVSALADPRGAGPRGAADPVNIGFRHFGKLEIDDMRDAVDVEAARRDVGCDEGARDAAAAKRVQRTFPLALALVAMNRASRDPAVVEMLGDLVGTAFRPCEDERPCHSPNTAPIPPASRQFMYSRKAGGTILCPH
jgi:hypothetical protein